MVDGWKQSGTITDALLTFISHFPHGSLHLLLHLCPHNKILVQGFSQSISSTSEKQGTSYKCGQMVLFFLTGILHSSHSS
jgi:hypothetical protein